MIEAAKWTMLIVSALVLAGGVMGFVKGKSKASLISGAVMAALLDLAFYVSLSDPRTGLIIGDGVSFLLFIVGTVRFRKTRKFMPAGLIQALGALSLVMTTLALVKG